MPLSQGIEHSASTGSCKYDIKHVATAQKLVAPAERQWCQIQIEHMLEQVKAALSSAEAGKGCNGTGWAVIGEALVGRSGPGGGVIGGSTALCILTIPYHG